MLGSKQECNGLGGMRDTFFIRRIFCRKERRRGLVDIIQYKEQETTRNVWWLFRVYRTSTCIPDTNSGKVQENVLLISAGMDKK